MDCSSANMRKTNFKSKNDIIMAGRNRQDNSISLRKLKREQSVLAKRMRLDNGLQNDIIMGGFSVDSIVSDIQSKDSSVLLRGVNSLRLALCSSNAIVQDVVESGAVAILANLLLSTNEILQSEVSWCLTNIATGNHIETGYVLVAVPNIIQLLISYQCTLNIKNQLCWVLGNIAADSDEYRQILVANGCLPVLVKLLISSVESADMHTAATAKTVAWTLSNLARGSTLASTFVAAGYVRDLVQLILPVTADKHNSMDDSIDLVPHQLQAEIWWMFAFLTAKVETTAVETYLQNGLIEALTIALHGECTSLHTPSSSSSSIEVLSSIIIPLIRSFGNLTSGPMEWLDMLFSSQERIDVISDSLLLLTTLSNADPSPSDTSSVVVKEALWVVSNIAGGREVHRRAILHSNNERASLRVKNVVDNVLDFVCISNDFDLQRMAVIALNNFCLDSDTLESIFSGNNRGSVILSQLVHIIKAQNDCDTLVSSMSIIGRLLDSSSSSTVSLQCLDLGLVDSLDMLQYVHGAEVVNKAATALADRLYTFMDDDTNDNDCTQTVNGCKDMSYDSFASNIQQQQQQQQQQSGLGRGKHLATPSWMNN